MAQPADPESTAPPAFSKDLVVSESVETLASTCQSDVPITVLVAILQSNKHLIKCPSLAQQFEAEPAIAATAADFEWEKFWDTVGVIDVAPTLLIDPIDEPENNEAATLSAQPRGIIAVARLALVAISVVWTIADRLFSLIWHDHSRRSQFTQDMVRSLWQNNRSFNYVICYTHHRVNFQGRPGDHYAHSTVTFPVWLGMGSLKFDIYSFRAGSFTLLGGGGYLNWAYIGRVRSDSGGRQPRTVVFQ